MLRQRTKKPRRIQRIDAAAVQPPHHRSPREWDEAIDTIIASWMTYNASVGAPPPPDERRLRASIRRRLPSAQQIFTLAHGVDDGQTCRCRMWALLTVISLETGRDDVEANQIFDTHKRLVNRYLKATREVN